MALNAGTSFSTTTFALKEPFSKGAQSASLTISIRAWSRNEKRSKNILLWNHRGVHLRPRCQSNEGENETEKEAKTATTTTTEEDQQTPTPPSSSIPPSTPEKPGNGFQAAPKTVQIDAFRFMELVGPEKVDPEDVKILRSKLFGYSTYWVTGQEPFGVLGEGVLLLGNLRGQKEEVFSKLQQGLKELMGDKYDLFMVEEPNAEGPDPRGGPRVSFLLLRKEVSAQGPTTFWQYAISIVLAILTAGSCLQLGFATQLQVAKLPPEVIQYFTNPESAELPDLQLLFPYVESALPLAYGVFGIHLFHEIGHSLAAAPLNVKLGVPYFIPNITLGSFGAITQFKSILPDRKAKFDISMAGPLAAGLLSFAMVGVGLALTVGGGTTGELVQIPSAVFRGSLLLGLLSRAVLDYDVMHSATVAVHPLLIAGWCGLTSTAFNLLPVGSIDGGRAVQAVFGAKFLNVSGLVTYLLLGLGILGGPLSLPWGLYILIVQRSAEKACLNDVTGVGTGRQVAYLTALAIVVLTLLPVSDGIADQLGIGLVSPVVDIF